MKKQVAIPVVLLLFFGCTAMQRPDRYLVPLGDSPSHGPTNAVVTVVEFTDFQ